MSISNGVPVPDRTRDLLNLSYVKRWVIAPMNREQSVAEHSYRVAVIVWGLHDILFSRLRSADSGSRNVFDLDRAIMCAITHDLEEVWTGDTPGIFKDQGHLWPDPDTLMSFEIAVKVADSLEAWGWWRQHGNTTWTHPMKTRSGRQGRNIRKIYHYTRDWPELLDAARTLVGQSMYCDELTLKATFPDIRDGAFKL